METVAQAIAAGSKAPFLEFDTQQVESNTVVHKGAGELRSIEVGHGGCSVLDITIDGRRVFRMAPTFGGSFYLGIGYNKELRVNLTGEFPCHLHLAYRPASGDVATHK